MKTKRRLNGQFVANKDEEIQWLRDELMRMNKVADFYKKRSERLMRQRSNRYEKTK